MSLTADEILSVSSPEKLFKGDGHTLYKQLMKQWHPDRGAPRATEVAAHINHLYSKYSPDMNTVNVFIGGREYKFHYIEQVALPFGAMYIGGTNIVQTFDSSAFFQRTVQLVPKYATPEMRKEHAKHIALPTRNGEDVYNRRLLLYRKPEGYFSLAQIKRKYPALPPAHVAWILSSLYNIHAYLQYANINYNAFMLDTVYVSPVDHDAYLVGGWPSWAYVGTPPRWLPTELVGLADPASKAHDSACIRKIGRELLGAELHKAPMPMQLWVKGPGRIDAYQEYKDWENVILKSFGERKYVKLSFDASDL